MTHEHVTYAEIIETADSSGRPGKVSVEDLRSQCQTCEEKQKKIRFMLSALKDKNLAYSEKTYNKLQNKVSDLESFYELVAGSRLAKRNNFFKKKENREKNKIITVRRVGFAVSGLVAASIIIAANFFYYKLVPGREWYTVKNPQAVTVTRKGLLFGSFAADSGRLLLQKDIISTKKRLVINAPGMRVTTRAGSTFSFNETKKANSIQLFAGEFFIHFPKKYKKQRLVVMPGKCVMRITGTKIYFAIVRKQSSFLIVEGAAQLQIPYKKQSSLTAYTRYFLNPARPGKELAAEKSDKKEIASLVETFKSKEKKTGKTVKQQKRLTLEQLQTKYKQLTVVKTLDNKIYIGFYMHKGSIVELITIYGLVRIDATRIKSIEPYKK